MSERQLGQWLKYHRKQRSLSQRQVAERIGVGQTTIANYENGSRFPDQQKLVALSRLFHASLDQLLGTEPVRFSAASDEKTPALPGPVEALEEILAHREDQLWNRIALSASHGMPLSRLYGDLFEPLLVETGRRWAAGTVSVAEEHLISYLTVSFMERARNYYPKSVPLDLSCVCASVPGEGHGIGLRMFRDLLELDGWATFFLGTNVPTDHFIRFVASFPVDLIALSVMLEEHLESARLMIDQIRRAPEIDGIPILLGGGALSRSERLWQEMGADAQVGTMEEGIIAARRLAAGRGKSGGS